MTPNVQTTEITKNQILDQAFVRFGRFGFGKTTMAEIAGDCEMSAGNLYRYFQNKKEIGAECAKRCMAQTEELMLEAVRQSGIDPVEKLTALVLAKLRHMHSQFAEQPLVMELVEYICQEQWELVGKHLGVVESLFEEVLIEGCEAGVFDVADCRATAKTLLGACMKYLSPYFMHSFSLAELEQEVRDLVRLVVRGLRKHPQV